MKFLNAFIFLWIFSSCNTPLSENAVNEHSSKTSLSDHQNFYKRLEGKIGNNEVVMHIQKNDSAFNAFYYYKNNGQWNEMLTDSTSSDTVFFNTWVPGTNWDSTTHANNILKLYFVDSVFKGELKTDNKVRPIALKESYTPAAIRMEAFTYKDSIAAFKNYKESPQAFFLNGYLLSKNEWLNDIFKTLLKTPVNESFETGLKAKAKSYFSEYKNEVSSVDTSTGLPLSTLNYSNVEQLLVRYNEKGFLILNRFFYNYSGGAHGNYGSTLYCIDVENKKMLALEDVITADSATLQPIVEKRFREQYGLKNKPLTEILFENKLAANSNFYFNDKGIGFIYNIYEVAAYVMGEINVFIPFSDLKDYLTPLIKNRMQ